MKGVLFHEEAEAELHAAFEWYSDISETLGRDFEASVRHVIVRIAEQPEAYPVYVDTKLRKCVTPRFPYAIYYCILTDTIWIVAVAHAHRRPGYWKNRVLGTEE